MKLQILLLKLLYYPAKMGSFRIPKADLKRPNRFIFKRVHADSELNSRIISVACASVNIVSKYSSTLNSNIIVTELRTCERGCAENESHIRYEDRDTSYRTFIFSSMIMSLKSVRYTFEASFNFPCRKQRREQSFQREARR